MVSFATRKQAKRARKKVSRSITLPAPYGGLYAKGSLAATPPQYAVRMVNAVSDSRGIAVREGYREHQTGILDPIESLMIYHAPNPANDKMFAAAGEAIYDVTTAGGTPTSVVSGATSAYWQSINFATSAGNYLVICNGVDAAKLYNGTSWTTFTEVVSPAVPGEVSGANPNTFINTTIHKKRVWFVQKQTTKAYYLPINSLGGTLGVFDFAGLFPRGGHLVAIDTWTLDGGEGLEDMFVAISSRGDVAVYKGVDPTSSSTWSLVGTYQIGEPIGYRCVHKFGGDLLVVCQDGLVPLSKALLTARIETKIALTDAIHEIVNSDVTRFKNITGWEVIVYPGHNYLIVNVPQPDKTRNYQYVMNTESGAWTKFDSIPANCWVLFRGDLYFATASGKVCRAFTGYADGAAVDGTGGTPCIARVQQAFSDLRATASQKRVAMVRPTIVTSDADPNYSININFDYHLDDTTGASTSSSLPISTWDEAIWDTSPWNEEQSVIADWFSVLGIGYVASAVITIEAKADTAWVQTDFLFETGDLL